MFGQIAESRAKLAGARTPEQTIQAANEQSAALNRLLVVVENYPQLRSNEQFARLMDELSGTENRVAVERMRYNERVQEYNTARWRFPRTHAACSGSTSTRVNAPRKPNACRRDCERRLELPETRMAIVDALLPNDSRGHEDPKALERCGGQVRLEAAASDVPVSSHARRHHPMGAATM